MTHNDILQEYVSLSDEKLVYVMANEIRGKVSLGIGFSEWLLREGKCLDKEQKEVLEYIKNSFDGINSILELAIQSRRLNREEEE
jgi:hypothetical protein